MRIVRIFFSKTDTAAYISHLDLQRVMARALRISGLPVWYSQGFNPHIYMSFALPLPLGQQSLCECVDCKTEAETEDFSAYIAPLSAALPDGIEVQNIAAPLHTVDKIATAEYRLQYHGAKGELECAVAGYNKAKQAPVLRKTKRSEQTVDLKQVLPEVAMEPEPAQQGTARFLLPAGGENYLNPALVCTYLQEAQGLSAQLCGITRLAVYDADGMPFR